MVLVGRRAPRMSFIRHPGQGDGRRAWRFERDDRGTGRDCLAASWAKDAGGGFVVLDRSVLGGGA